ncbi:MAG: penicillin-binding protein activator LpoB [Treponema sp.]|nr:penicillin-binding protein activator LpoB [Treponema sp.]
MKFVALGMLTWMLVMGVETAHARSSIDSAIRNAAESFSDGFQVGTRIAVVSMQSGSDRMSGHLIDGMIDALVDMGRFAVVSRSEIELALLRGELDFNMSAEVDEWTAQSIGRFLGAQLIATGTFETFGDAYRLRVRVIEVETAVIRATHAESILVDRLVRYLLGTIDPARFWSLGASIGTSFARPWVVGTLQATLAPLSRSFVRIGLDLGTVSGTDVYNYVSVFPLVHYAFFIPFDALPLPFARGGWHIGIGCGIKIEELRFQGFALRERAFMMDFVTGFVVGDMLDISYTLRTDFYRLMQKVSVGFVYRFQ